MFFINNRILHTVLSFALIVGLLFSSHGSFVLAQTSTLTASQEAALKKQLAEVEAEIAAQQKVLEGQQRETVSIERDIAILDTKIAQSKLKIQAKNIAIAQLGKDISQKSATIKDLSLQIVSNQESLSQLIKQTHYIDNISLVEVLLSSESVSDVFSDLDVYEKIKGSLYNLSQEAKNTRVLTESERAGLDKRRKIEVDAQQAIEAEKRAIEKDEAEKQRLLKLSKNQEAGYKAILSERQAHAASIRATLFALRDSAAIPFGVALEYANEAYKKTGVRPAFLLAILTQESNLGQNVGTCNRSGDSAAKSYTNIMPGPEDKASGRSYRDDQTIFLSIVNDLGRDPNNTPLSCPMSGGGWGGAMGPAQFIPTTWNSFVPQLKQLLGVKTPDPWNPKHAFMASSLFLGQLGASAGTYSSEREAALRYYAGGNWSKPQNAFYGNQVMAKATNIQENMIDPLKDL